MTIFGVARHSGASIRHSEIARANPATLPGIGLRTEGAGRDVLAVNAVVDYLEGLRIAGQDVATLIANAGGGGPGGGLTEEVANTLYRRLGVNVPMAQVEGLITALQRKLTTPVDVADGDLPYRDGGVWVAQTLLQIYTANEFFAAEKGGGSVCLSRGFSGECGGCGDDDRVVAGR